MGVAVDAMFNFMLIGVLLAQTAVFGYVAMSLNRSIHETAKSTNHLYTTISRMNESLISRISKTDDTLSTLVDVMVKHDDKLEHIEARLKAAGI